MGRREHAPLPLGALEQPEGRPTLVSSGHMVTSHRPKPHRTAVSGRGSMKRTGQKTGTAPLTDFTTPTDPPIARSTPARRLYSPAHRRRYSTAGQVDSAIPCTSTCRSRTVTEIRHPQVPTHLGRAGSSSSEQHHQP